MEYMFAAQARSLARSCTSLVIFELNSIRMSRREIIPKVLKLCFLYRGMELYLM